MSRPARVTVTFLLGVALFLLVPFMMWGITELPMFLDNPVRLGYILAVLLLNAIAAYRIPEVGKPREKPKTTVGRQRLAFILLEVFTVLMVVVAPYCDRREVIVLSESIALRSAGLAMYVVGFLTMHVAEYQLGRQFSTDVAIQEGHALVTDGLYRRLRHPRYLGIMIFSVGISLVFRSGAALFLSAATLIVLLWRIPVEESLLHEEFGPGWDAYARTSWRLIPFIY